MRRVLGPLVLSLALLTGVAGGFMGSARLDDNASSKGDFFDARALASVIGPSEAQVDAIVSLVKEHRGDVRIRWNRRFGTPSTIIRYGKTLTGPRAGSPADAARAWLGTHAGLFGWGKAEVAALKVEKTLAQPKGGARMVLFHQLFGGLHGGSLGGSTVVALDVDNRVLSVRANVVRVPKLDRSFKISAARALQIASGKPASQQVGRKGEWLRFARGGFAADHYVRQVAFPQGSGPARPAWEVFFVKRLNQGYRTVIDAETGKVLYRYQLARNEAPEGLVFDTYPGAPKGGEQVMRSFAGDPTASPDGWLSILGSPNLPTTLGNNASTATNWAVYLVPDGPGQLRPIAPTGVFDFAFTDAWQTSECGANPISTMEGLPTTGGPDTPTYALDALPAVTNLFYHHNVMHDFFYKLGFTEEAGAMQVSNFGKTGADVENDPLIGLAQAGALGGDAPLYLGRDNAYMFPWPDGIPSWSGMFIWESVPGAIEVPCVDGDFATDVIYHEYAHGVTNRWIGGEFGNLESQQGGSMGESWSDFYALHYLHSNGFETRDELGWYVTPSPNGGIRNWSLGDVPVTLADIGYDVSNEEVHSDGEIWNGVLWDLRQTFLKAKGQAGADLIAQLVADAMPISGPIPSMVDMRDAILAADVARTKGANQTAMWTVFARHGMGKGAFSIDGFDINPKPAFDHPDAARNGIVTGRVVDAATGKAIANAKLIVSEFEARISPVTRSASDGSFRFAMQAGQYPLTVVAPGYGLRTLRITVEAGKTLAREFGLGHNYASAAGGAEAKSANASLLGAPKLAIDDTAETAWWADAAADGSAAGESIVIDLAGTKPVDVAEIRISGFPAKGAGAGAALKKWSAHVSLDGKTFTKATEGSFDLDPVFVKSPDVNYQTVRLAKTAKAAFVKIVAEETMDPASAEVSISEIQVFGSGERVTVTPPPAVSDMVLHDEGMIIVPSPATNLTFEVMSAGACIFPPPTQGIDAWVTELPEGFGDGSHVIDSRLETLLPDPRPDLDLFMMTADCVGSGNIATGAPRETGTIPQGSKYVVNSLFTTLPGNVVVEAKGIVAGLLPPVPVPKVLAGTGVSSGAPIGLGIAALITAIGVGVWVRRGGRAAPTRAR